VQSRTQENTKNNDSKVRINWQTLQTAANNQTNKQQSEAIVVVYKIIYKKNNYKKCQD
jgi:hypothetical protein